MTASSEFIDLQEVLEGRRKIRNAYVEGVWKFGIKVVPIGLLIAAAMFLVSFLFRQDLAPRTYLAIAAMTIVAFGVLPTLFFAGWMARQYFWYHKELRVLEKRIRAGERVLRPNPARNADARQESPRAG